MLCKEIMEIIEKDYPPSSALEWDNVGLLAGRDKKEVGRIYIALDATDQVVREAAAAHPRLFLSPHRSRFCPTRGRWRYERPSLPGLQTLLH